MKKRIKKRSGIAKALQSPHFRQRVKPNKKRRKQKNWRGEIAEDTA